MNKKLLIPILAVLALGSVFAAVYYVNTINLTVDVKEPFTVQYAILGDAGNYNGEACPSPTGDAGWTTLTDGSTINKDGFYPMESRFVCIKITNAGQASIPYVIKSITTSGTNYAACQYAFADMTKVGTAISGVTVDGALVTISADAAPIADCNVQISVGRGTA